MSIDILELVWDNWNIEHVAKHGSSITEVETVCFGTPVRYKESYKNRTILIGQGLNSSLLTVIIGPVPNHPVGHLYAFSARPASKKERAFYVATRGIQTS